MVENSREFSVPKEHSDYLLNAIQKMGNLKIINRGSGDGYFIFEKGDNTVHRFKIKGCKRWRFGIWFEKVYIDDKETDDTKYKVSIFGEHEWKVNKFKPSAVTLCKTGEIPKSDLSVEMGEGIKYPDWEELWVLLYDFCMEVNKIKSSNIFAFFWLYNADFYRSESIYLSYLKEWFYYEIREKLIEFRRNQLTFLSIWLIKIWFRIRHSGNFTPVIEDNKLGGWNVWPRYILYIIDENMVEMVKLEKVYYFWNWVVKGLSNVRITFTTRNEDGTMNKRGFYLKENGEVIN
jgi:hypothetical protein